jgi:hypothetical protein
MEINHAYLCDLIKNTSPIFKYYITKALELRINQVTDLLINIQQNKDKTAFNKLAESTFRVKGQSKLFMWDKFPLTVGLISYNYETALNKIMSVPFIINIDRYRDDYNIALLGLLQVLAHQKNEEIDKQLNDDKYYWHKLFNIDYQSEKNPIDNSPIISRLLHILYYGSTGKMEYPNFFTKPLPDKQFTLPEITEYSNDVIVI